MSAFSLRLAPDDDTPPIRLHDTGKTLEFTRINGPWLAALILIGCAAGGLMTAPLLRLSSRRVRPASAWYGAGGPPTTSAIVGIRGDRLQAEASAAPPVLERRLELRRLGRLDLRSYTFVLAKPSLARTAAYQDFASAYGAAAQRAGSGTPGGLVGLHSAAPLGTPVNVTSVGRSLLVAPPREVVVLQEGDTLEAVLRAAHLSNEAAATAAVLLGAQLPGQRVAGGDLMDLEGSDRAAGPAKPWRIRCCARAPLWRRRP